MAVPAFMARDFVAQPINENPASAPVVPAFGGSAPATYASTYVPSFATRWVEALQDAMTALMGEIQGTLNEADSRLNDLEGNVAGYQDAAQVQGAIATELASYDDSATVDSKIASVNTGDALTSADVDTQISSQLANYDDSATVDAKIAGVNTGDALTSADVDTQISAQLTSYDDSSAVDSKIAQAKSDLIGGAGNAYDTLLELKTAYENADDGLTGLINNKAESSDLADAVARIGALEQLVNDLHSSTYGQ